MMRVVIVDDQPDFRSQLRQLLTLAGLVVVGEAGDISTAELLVQQEQPDLAIVDVVLPGVNGLDGTKKLKTICPRMRVIIVSAYLDRADVIYSAAKEVGAVAFVSKDDLDLQMLQSWKE